MNAAHIHVGPGQLGLGLIVRTSIAAGLRPHVVHPDPGRTVENPSMSVVECRGAEEDEPFTLHDKVEFCCGEALAALSDSLLKDLRAAEDVLITTSLGAPVLRDCFDLLRAMIDERPRRDGYTTVFIACENNPGEPYKAFASELERRGVDVRHTMVNRLCYWSDESHDEDEAKASEKRKHTRVVRADRFQEWVISGDPLPPTLAALATLDHVRFEPASEVIEAIETRKRWLVNGAHLALALLAQRRRAANLNVEAARADRRQYLEQLQKDLARAVDLRFEGMFSDNDSYAAEHREVWANHRDETKRVLGRVRRAGLEALFKDVDRKLGEPARLLVNEPGDLPNDLAAAFEALQRIMLLAPNYLDFKELIAGRLQLDKEADDRALAAYHKMLVPLIGVTKAKDWREALGAALAKDRR